MKETLKLLQTSNDLKKIFSQVDKLISSNSFTDKELSLFSISIILEIQRQLNISAWSDVVDCQVLSSLVFKIYPYISCNEGYQICLSATYAIYRFLLKKGVFSNDLKFLNFVFKNTKLPIKSKCYKFYWNMLIDALNSLNITDKSEAKSVLLDIVQYSIQIMEICDLVQFCKSNLSWLLRKLYIMFNEIAAEDLESGLEKIFDFLNTKSSFVSSKEYDDSSVLEETFKNLLHSYSCTIQLISTIGFISNKSMIKLHKICIKIFNRDKTYTEYFKILESLQFLFSTPLTKFPPNYYEKVTKANSDFAKIKKNNSNRSFQEFVLIFRKILNFKLLEWTNVPKDVWKTHMSLELQEALLRLLIILMDHLKYCDVQGVKCINCNFESGHHDALQIASFGKIFIANSACKEVSLSKLIQCTTEIFNKQINSILQLRDKDCPSWNNFYDNVEKGYHKDAILLYSLGKVESSLNIFNAYMSAFAKFFTRDNQITYHATLSRVLYNMSVCQFDVLNIDEDSLKNCYLSMALNSVENKEASSKFYIQFIVKIKTKLIDVHNSSKKLCKYEKHKIVIECECCDNIENIISSNIWSVCDKIMVKNDMYRILLKNVDFMSLLLSELESLHSLWFSAVPVTGICNAFKYIIENQSNIKKDFTQELEILYYLGKIITLINTRANLIRIPEIANFVRISLSKYESFFSNNTKQLDEKNKTLLYLFFGNILFTLYEIVFYEKSIVDKFAPLATTADVQKCIVTTHPDDECDLASTHLSLRLSVEDTILEPILKAMDTWKAILKIPMADLTKVLRSEENKMYIEKSFENMECAIRILHLRSWDTRSIMLADIVYSLSLYADNTLCTIRTVGFVIQNTNSRAPDIVKIIFDTNKLLSTTNFKTKWFDDLEAYDIVLEYLLNLAIYYHNCNLKEEGFKILDYVQTTILNFIDRYDDKQNVKLSFAKLIDVQSLYLNSDNDYLNTDESISYLASLENGYVEFRELLSLASRHEPKGLTIIQLWIKSGLNAGKAALLLGLPRRSRTILKSMLLPVHQLLLPQSTIEILLTLASNDICSEKYDDCKVKLNIIQYIMEERFEGAVQNIKKLALTPESKIQENHEAVFTEISDQFEVILDANAVSNLNDNLSGSPTFHPSLFNMPLFIEHKNICMCSRCTSVTFFTSTLEMINIQANLYYKTNEVLVAQSFMNGGFKLIKYLDAKLNYLNSNCFKINLNFRLEKIEEFSYIDSLNFSKCQFLRDTSYILIKENNLVKAESLNKQAIDMLSLVRPESHFLMQSVHEQKIFFLQSKVFKEETQNTLSNVDQLSNDLAAKLIVSPKKTDTASFKTPYERRTRPPNDSNRLKLNKGKNLFSDLLEATNFILPVIKFNLIDDNNTKSSAIREDTKSSAFNENLAKTPIVKFRLNKNVLLDNEPQTSNSNLPTKTRLRSNISKSTKIETSNVSKVQSKTKMKSKNPPKTSENEVNSDKVKTRSRSKVLSEVSSVKK